MRITTIEISALFWVFTCSCYPALFSVYLNRCSSLSLETLLRIKHIQHILSSDVAWSLHPEVSHAESTSWIRINLKYTLFPLSPDISDGDSIAFMTVTGPSAFFSCCLFNHVSDICTFLITFQLSCFPLCHFKFNVAK